MLIWKFDRYSSDYIYTVYIAAKHIYIYMHVYIHMDLDTSYIVGMQYGYKSSTSTYRSSTQVLSLRKTGSDWSAAHQAGWQCTTLHHIGRRLVGHGIGWLCWVGTVILSLCEQNIGRSHLVTKAAQIFGKFFRECILKVLLRLQWTSLYTETLSVWWKSGISLKLRAQRSRSPSMNHKQMHTLADIQADL